MDTIEKFLFIIGTMLIALYGTFLEDFFTNVSGYVGGLAVVNAILFVFIFSLILLLDTEINSRIKYDEEEK